MRIMKKNLKKTMARKNEKSSIMKSLKLSNESLQRKNVYLTNYVNKVRQRCQSKTGQLTFSSVRLESKTFLNNMLSSKPTMCTLDSFRKIISCSSRSGTFGSTYPVNFCKLSGMVVVAKEIDTKLSTPLEISVEAKVGHLLSGHTNFPFVFGFVNPNIILMQNLGELTEHGEFSVNTVHDYLYSGTPLLPSDWLSISNQILCAISEMHELQILHNDIKSNNIIIHRNKTPFIIDFGKATAVQCPSKYNLSNSQKGKYKRKYPHLAPDLVDGLCAQSVLTDTYSIGFLFSQIGDAAQNSKLQKLSPKMMQYFSQERPSLKDAIAFLM